MRLRLLATSPAAVAVVAGLYPVCSSKTGIALATRPRRSRNESSKITKITRDTMAQSDWNLYGATAYATLSTERSTSGSQSFKMDGRNTNQSIFKMFDQSNTDAPNEVHGEAQVYLTGIGANISWLFNWQDDGNYYWVAQAGSGGGGTAIGKVVNGSSSTIAEVSDRFHRDTQWDTVTFDLWIDTAGQHMVEIEGGRNDPQNFNLGTNLEWSGGAVGIGILDSSVIPAGDPNSTAFWDDVSIDY